MPSWSPDGRFLASGDDAKTIHLWEALTGQRVYVYQGHKCGIRALAWSPTLSPINTRIASAGLDSLILIWQAL